MFLVKLAIIHAFLQSSVWCSNVDELCHGYCELQVTSVKELSGQICQICGDEIEIADNGEPFVACNECAFPVCRPCYEYERREGNQACPQCKTRYKRLKG